LLPYFSTPVQGYQEQGDYVGSINWVYVKNLTAALATPINTP